MAVTEGQLISDGTAVWKVKKIGSEVPAGIMQMFAGNTIPAGWLLCDGSTISEENYPELVAVLGGTQLPNLIDRFLQGSATAGTYKEAGLPNITGSFHSRSYSNAGITNTRGAFHCESYTTNQQIVSGSGEGSSQYTFDASRSSTIYGNSTIVQPPAYTAKIYICYAG